LGVGEMTFRVGDRGQTRGGDDYEVVAVLDRPHQREDAIVYIRTDFRGEGIPETVAMDGMSDVCGLCLLPPKQKIEGFIWVFRNGQHVFSQRRPEKMIKVIACIPISIPYTEGDGLD